MEDLLKAPIKGSEDRTSYTIKNMIDVINKTAGYDKIHWIHINFKGTGANYNFSNMDDTSKDHISLLQAFGKNTLYRDLKQDVFNALMATAIPSNETANDLFEHFINNYIKKQ